MAAQMSRLVYMKDALSGFEKKESTQLDTKEMEKSYLIGLTRKRQRVKPSL